MLFYRKYLFTALMLSCIGVAYGQTSPSNDGLFAVRVHQLSNYLSLSSSQEHTLLSLEKQQQQSLDSLGHLTLGPDQRKSALAGTLYQHDRQIKALFSAVQWKKYEELLEQRRQAFLKRASDKKVTIQELPRQKP
jgi:hypothetical protein